MPTPRAHSRQSGNVLIITMLVLPVLLAMMLLALDLARIQTAKSQLYDASEGVARYAVTGLVDGTAITKAQAVASQVTLDGRSITVANSDIELGIWRPSTETFTPDTTNPNAVRVTVRRSTSNGNPMSLTFGPAFGMPTCDVKATSISYYNQNVMLVVGNTTLNAADTAMKNRLAGMGYHVVVTQDSAVTATDAQDMRLVVVSETSTAANIGSRLCNVTVPVVCDEPLLFDDMQMAGPTEGTNYGCSNSCANRITITAPTHPIAAGFSGTVTVTTQGNTNGGAGIGWGVPMGSAAMIATVYGESGHYALLAYDTGSTLINGTSCPARRVGLFGCSPNTAGMGGIGADTWSANGWTIFDASVAWAVSPTPPIRTVRFVK